MYLSRLLRGGLETKIYLFEFYNRTSNLKVHSIEVSIIFWSAYESNVDCLSPLTHPSSNPKPTTESRVI